MLRADVGGARGVEKLQVCVDAVEVFLAQDLAEKGQVATTRFPCLYAVEFLERSGQTRALGQKVALFAREGRNALAQITQRMHLALDLCLGRRFVEICGFVFVVQGMHPRVLTAGSLTFRRWS